MIKKYFVFLLILLSGCSSGDDEPVDENQIQARQERGDVIFYRINSETPFTGKTVSYFPSGQMEDRTTYKEGKAFRRESWRENGQKSCIFEFTTDSIGSDIESEECWDEKGNLINNN